MGAQEHGQGHGTWEPGQGQGNPGWHRHGPGHGTQDGTWDTGKGMAGTSTAQGHGTRDGPWDPGWHPVGEGHTGPRPGRGCPLIQFTLSNIPAAGKRRE